MPTAIKLDHRKPITYESALNKDANIISQATYLKAATELYYFNVCIPIEVRSIRGYKKLIFRYPMPHKLAEAKYPGTVDEKLSSEFVHEEQRPFYIRLWRMFQRRLRNLLRCHTLSPYSAHLTSQRLSATYIILEYISPNTGQMLSSTWEKHRKDLFYRQNLFQGMARLILSLANIPQPRIGLFQFHTNGTITLTNRPLPYSIVILENKSALRTIQRNETYTYTKPFVTDMLTLHKNSFLSNPNAAYNEDDCRGYIAAKALLKILSHYYVERKHRNEPFYLYINEIMGDNLYKFDEVRQEFMKIFEAEEVNLASKQKPTLASIMYKDWESDEVWFWRCLTSTNTMISLVEDYICPRFSRLSFKAKEIFS
ncbi:hypothetical protein DL95DRAFT_426991 [Leptodontidium sp. 2 PMI_412]|nr:hypothetical protein DL95DRAFT_426991 [Leptodontidium sp. 2 PMI_412]